MFMKSISNAKNIPQINDKKSTHRSAKLSFIAQNSSFLSFENINQIIINTEALPIELVADSVEWKQLNIVVNSTHLVLKNLQESYNLPLPVDKKKWLKLAFGKEMLKIQVRPRFNENKISRKNIFGSFTSWKNSYHEELTELTSLNLTSCLSALRQKINNINKTEIKSQGKIAGFIKSKLSERRNANSQKPKSTVLKYSEHSIHTVCSKELSQYKATNDNSETNSVKQSTTLSLKIFLDKKNKLGKRQINTSNEQRMLEVSNKLVKIKMNKVSNNTLDIQAVEYPNEGELQPLHTFANQKKYRPRFCQQIPLSYEEVESKRKKFDSQFMTKANILTKDIKTNESEVTEQIVKQDGSQVVNFEDTFERGIGNKNEQKNNQSLADSGTLCQSVFQ